MEKNMFSEKFTMFYNRLVKVYKLRHKIATKQKIICYRLYDHDLPEFPLMIDVYDDKLYVAEYLRRHGLTDEEHDEWWEQTVSVIEEITGITENNIFVKERRRKADRLSQYEKTDTAKNTFVVEENNLKFIVNLQDYLDTGLFLDHAITRQMVREWSEHKNVLNLFGYTGSFSVYARAGGASLVTSVDLSNTYTNWTADNLKLNKLYNDKETPCVAADVLQWLQQAPKPIYDIIILDPPTFSNSKKMKVDYFEVQEHHTQLILQCKKWLSPTGKIIFSNNHTKFILNPDLGNHFTIKDITKATTRFDFEKKLKRNCWILNNKQN
jgi:23S rRNA (cytosine1962-C5)-methyltransferase